ncbi:hypothetical protein Pmani_023683 [Petrolisthes manimaculis]|uniref:Reelin domain-containing protein n=1 Tax=Petrolisthes manimaculis TaxID=1843537 RepID=A0AAE1U311_9EUCA|nr:hypothetical protein Pmani_023683 [Petrolisthes manimaculis]
MPHVTVGFSSSSVSLACDSLQPGHLAVPSTSDPPFRIHITPRTSGYYVTVKGNGGQKFRGFLLEARDVQEEGRRAGRFLEVQDSGRIISCSFGGGGVQHSDGSIKNQVTALWNPHNFTGQVIFRATVVESYFIYWTGIESDVLNLV